jgi:hypothetical protein
MGVYLTGMYLMGVHLTGVHLIYESSLRAGHGVARILISTPRMF